MVVEGDECRTTGDAEDDTSRGVRVKKERMDEECERAGRRVGMSDLVGASKSTGRDDTDEAADEISLGDGAELEDSEEEDKKRSRFLMASGERDGKTV